MKPTTGIITISGESWTLLAAFLRDLGLFRDPEVFSPMVRVNESGRYDSFLVVTAGPQKGTEIHLRKEPV